MLVPPTRLHATPTGSPVRGRAARGHGSSLHLLARPTTLVLADLGHGDPAWLHPCSPVAHQSFTVHSGAERKQPFSTCLIRKYISYTLNSKHRIIAMKIGQHNAFDRNFVVYSPYSLRLLAGYGEEILFQKHRLTHADTKRLNENYCFFCM